MVKRRKTTKKGVRGYKKCILGGLRSTKFKTALQARKAFSRVVKKCRAKLMGHAVAKRRKTTRKSSVGKRKCKYGRRKGSKRCRKTPRR